MTSMNGATYIAKFLENKGVGHVFGYPGGAILNVINAIASTNSVEYVQNYHEQASAFCADAYARIYGGVGVAVATSGPGATNLITGIASSHFDSVPCLFITGQERTIHLRKNDNIRQNGFQDMDVVEMVRPVTKYAKLIIDPQQLRFELEKAWHVATTGRKGAVLLDIPSDIQVAEVDPSQLAGFAPESVDSPNIVQVREFIALLKASRRPTVLVGGGVRIDAAEDSLRKFLKRVGLPIVATLRGLDCHENIVSFSGTYGNTSANLAVANADLLIVLGARLSLMQVGKFKEKYTQGKIVHVDIDPHEFGRALPEALSIHADLKEFLLVLDKELVNEKLPDFSEWEKQVLDWNLRFKFNAAINTQGLDPVKAIWSISESFSEDAIITSDVGQNQMWVAQALVLKRDQRLLNSGGHGAMGYSLPASIGAKIAAPGRQVIAFMGDGGFQMNLQELQLISQRKLNIKCVVLNNRTLGMVKDLQRYFKMDFHGTDERYYGCPDLNLLAQAYGLNYMAVTDEDSLSEVSHAIQDDLPWIIEVTFSTNSELFNIYRDSAIFEECKIND